MNGAVVSFALLSITNGMMAAAWIIVAGGRSNDAALHLAMSGVAAVLLQLFWRAKP